MLLPMSIFGQSDSISTLLKTKINHEGQNPVHSILLQIENDSKKFSYKQGFGLVDKNGAPVTKDSAFKIASSTKLFVSTIVLQLEEEGKLTINDLIGPYLQSINYLNFDNLHHYQGAKYAQDITIEHLLSHRSGLADIFTDKQHEFFELLFSNPTVNYSPESLIKLYYQMNLNNLSHFEPDQGWHYSDVNYLLLGLLIEQVDNVTLAQSIRNRILEPLQMEDTFFEYYEAPKKTPLLIKQYVGAVNFSNINTSFDWSGGGVVSTNNDLTTFIKALFEFKLISEQSLTKMTAVRFTKKNESRYGLGVYEFTLDNDTYFGHFGFYNTFVGYCPTSGTSLSYSISQATPNFNTYQFIGELLRQIDIEN